MTNSNNEILLNEKGMNAKTRYGVKGSQIIQSIQPTKDFYNLAKMDSLSIERKILTSDTFKYKKLEKVNKLKSLLKICYNYTTDIEDNTIDKKKKKEGALGYCIFTDHTLSVLKDQYNISMSKAELRRLVDAASDLGFLVPNTYKDSFGISRKNFRYDLKNPSNSYSTSYLVNFKAISSYIGKEIRQDNKKYYQEENHYIDISDNLEKEAIKIQDSLVTQENKKLFSGIFENGYLLREGTKKLYIPQIGQKGFSQLNLVFYDLLRLLKEDGKVKPKEISHDKRYKEIVKMISITDFEDQTSYDTCIFACTQMLFNWKTNGAYSFLEKLLNEYNEDKNSFNKKEFPAHIGKTGVTGRGFSKYCKTSKTLEESDTDSREYWKNKNNIIYSKDVTSMIPNLSRFLKDGDKFRQDDLYSKMCQSIKKEYNLEVSREEMKQVFLRFKFSKTLPLALSQIKRAFARENALDSNISKVFVNYKTGKANYWLTDEWYKSDEGKRKIAAWTAIYKTIEKTCSISKDSLIFFWESLLEQIVLTNLKRQNITCYNIYDEFFADKKFNLEKELENASKIVLEAYNRNTDSLKKFTEA